MTRPVKTPTPPPTPAPVRRPHRSRVRAALTETWRRTRHSTWRAGVYVIAATPLIDYHLTGAAHPAVVAVTAAGAAAPVAVIPRLRHKAAVDMRAWPLTIRARRRWRTYTSEPGCPLTYPATGWETLTTGATTNRPRIRYVTKHTDGYTVRFTHPRFLTQREWEKAAAGIGRVFRAHTPQPFTTGGETELRFRDTPAGNETGAITPIPAWEAQTPQRLPSLDALPVTHGRDGIVPLRLLGTHLLIIGETGSGKGSVIWAIVRAVAPGVPDRTVELWGIDPKGGVELSMGAALFTRLVLGGDDTFETDVAAMLEEAVTVMHRRLVAMRQKTRLFTPTPGDPHIIIIIDEYLILAAAITDKDTRERIEIAQRKLLSQGRAAGVTMIAAAQLAQKSLLDTKRDLFPLRCALRLPDPASVDMVLGRGALRNGAKAHLLPRAKNEAGHAYLLEEGGLPVLVRFPWSSDESVRALAAVHPAPVGSAATHPTPQALGPARPATKRAHVEGLVEAGVTDPAALATAAGCSVQFARRVLNEVQTHPAQDVL